MMASLFLQEVRKRNSKKNVNLFDLCNAFPILQQGWFRCKKETTQLIAPVKI